MRELSIVPGKARRKEAKAKAKATKAGTNKTEGRPPAEFRFKEKKKNEGKRETTDY